MPTRRLPMGASAAASSTTRRQRESALGRHGRRRAGADQADDGFPRSAYVQAGTLSTRQATPCPSSSMPSRRCSELIAVPKLSR